MTDLWIIVGIAFGIWQYYRGKRIGHHEREQEFWRQQEIGYQKAVESFDKLASGDLTEDQWRNPSLELFQVSSQDILRWSRLPNY